MKKVITLTLLGMTALCSAYGQANKIQPCDCNLQLKKSDSQCPTPKEITLVFDSCSQRITGQSQDWLKSNQDYIFVIKPINSALYSTKTAAANITRTASLPPVINSLLPNGFITSGALSEITFSKKVTGKPLVKPEYDDYFLERFQYDYNVLQVVSSQVRILLKDISANNTQTAFGNFEACTKLNAIKSALTGYQAKVTPLTQNETDDFAIATGKKVCDQKEFKSLMVLTISDYLNRVKILNLSSRTIGALLDDDELTIMNRTADLVKKDSSFLAQSADILFNILNAAPHIDSNPYRITGDYLQLNIALLKAKFSDRPDTVSMNKLNFYKIGYWKWLDISAGIFYDNLASKSFYFNNGGSQAEIKSRADISVGALAHSYWVFDSWFKAGPCAGVAVSLLDGKSKYLFGGSLVFGRNNEWAFSGGYALASLPQASNFYKQGNYTQTTTTTTTGGASPGVTSSQVVTSPVGVSGTVNTYNKLQGGVFAGITYSFLKL